jgi:hypothetical protein
MYKQKQWRMNKIEVQKTINIQTQGTILQKKKPEPPRKLEGATHRSRFSSNIGDACPSTVSQVQNYWG